MRATFKLTLFVVLSMVLLTGAARAQDLNFYFCQLGMGYTMQGMSGTLDDGNMTLTWSGDGLVFQGHLTGTLIYPDPDILPAMIADYDLTSSGMEYQIIITNPEEIMVDVKVGNGDLLLDVQTAEASFMHIGTFEAGSAMNMMVVQPISENVAVDLLVEYRVGNQVPNETATLDQLKALYR